jgi:hypothetical protein
MSTDRLTKEKVVLRKGEVADLAWLARTVIDSGAKDGLYLAAMTLLEKTRA